MSDVCRHHANTRIESVMTGVFVLDIMLVRS